MGNDTKDKKTIHCEKMENYIGPNILYVKVGENDVTEQIKILYGIKNDWRCRWWTFEDVFNESVLGKIFHIEYENGECQEVTINRLKSVLNWNCEYDFFINFTI